MIRLTLADPSSSDFTIFYYTARMVADGLPMYGESPARYGVTWAAGHLGNLNPPHFQILFVPLASLPYGQALLAWVAFSFACLAASLVVIFRELQVPFTWTRFVSWGAFTIGLAPFTTVAVTSEMTFVLMLPFALLWRAWRRGQWASAGAWLGVLVSLKLFFLLLAAWLALRREWRALGACAAATLVLVLLGGGVFGFDAYRLWTGSLGTVGWQWMAMNASWPGYASRRAARRRNDRAGHLDSLARAAHGGARRGLRAGGYAAVDLAGPRRRRVARVGAAGAATGGDSRLAAGLGVLSAPRVRAGAGLDGRR